ncbi:TIGR01458 family HAD-type hydrolase [Marinobacter sp.]|uniref:TIGR01458 family HAD-type hydrolase n=1 Tax=Marinobacter sp. TaxID=50741 RepID=UPI0038506D6D
MTSLAGLCIDISGVLIEEGKTVAGAREAMEKLREAGLSCRFLTNTSRKPASAVLDQLRDQGFDVNEDEVMTAPQAVAAYLKEHDLRPWLLIHPDIRGEFSALQTDDPNAVVVCDAGERFDYQNLDRAFSLLMEDAPLLAVGMNRYFRKEGGLHLDAGPFIRALEYAADVEATIIGKPGRQMFQAACDSMEIDSAACLMIGDDVSADIGGAVDAGLKAALVRTGKYRAEDDREAERLGAGVFDDFASVVFHWL